MAKPTKKLGIGIRRRSKAQRHKDCRKGGEVTGAKFYREHLGIFARTTEQVKRDAVAGGRRAGQIAVASGRVRTMGRTGGLIGGKIVGLRHIASGFMRHISLIRHALSHNDCRFCKPEDPEAF
jgi:hypothetical protein